MFRRKQKINIYFAGKGIQNVCCSSHFIGSEKAYWLLKIDNEFRSFNKNVKASFLPIFCHELISKYHSRRTAFFHRFLTHYSHKIDVM